MNAGYFGTFADPDDDCEFKLVDGTLSIAVPGKDHDLGIERGKMNAPRALQMVEGDFTVQVKVAGQFEPSQKSTVSRGAYIAAGFFISSDDSNYIRLDRATLLNGKTHVAYVNFELRVNGQIERFGTASGNVRLDNSKETWLRIERTGSEFRAYATQESGKWQLLGAKTMTAPRRIQVGVAAINGSLQSVTARYSEFELKTRTQSK